MCRAGLFPIFATVELSAKRTFLFGLAALGAAALIADRVLLGGGSVTGPAEAQASYEKGAVEAGAGVSRTDTSTGTAVRRSGARPDSPLLHRMKELPEADDYPRVAGLNAFKPPEAWLPEPVEVVEEEPEPEPDRRAENFAAMHRLTAVMSGPSGDLAVIGGQTIRLGQSLDGFTLVAVDSRSAIFREGDVEVTLTLPEPSGRPDRK